MIKMILVEKHIITDKSEYYSILDNLCYLSKNLYNATLYAVKQHFFNTKEYLSYINVNRLFVQNHNNDYYALPSKVSQQVQKLVDSEFKSFFSRIKHKSYKDCKKIRIPKYLDKLKGRQVVLYTKQAVSTTNLQKCGYFTLSKVYDNQGNLIKFYTKVDNIQFVRIVHKGNHIVIEVGYNKIEKPYKHNNNVAAIDLGLNNLATVTTNIGKPFIINGRPLKYINNQYNKRLAVLQSAKMYCQKSDKQWTNQMYRVRDKRNNRINDYLHKASRSIVNYLVLNHITTLVIGKNDGWKQNINLGKRNNQNFVQIPFNMFINMLEYKCALAGIKFITLNESYTSKCSFIDNEDIKHHKSYAGKRITRDLFKTANNICINADVNGSYNIMKRYCLLNNRKHCLRFNKQEVCCNPEIITIRLNNKNVF